MNSTFQINSDTCLMCNNQLMRKIGELQGVFGADVDYVNNVINVQHTDEVTKEEIQTLLISLGLQPLNYENNNI